jgi:glycine/D-amino acid oxidase-like deaminating enzyme
VHPQPEGTLPEVNSLGQGDHVPETVAVLGSGIVGASAAYHLSRTPGVRVMLVDGGHPGQATAAGAGIVAPGVSIRPPAAWYPFAAAAVHAYPPLLDALKSDGEPDAGYEICGGLFVATSDDEAARLDDVQRLIVERAREGMPNIGTVSRLEPAETARLLPAIAPGTCAVHVDRGARVDGRRLRDALARAARRRGATVRLGAARLTETAGAVTGVAVDGERVPCEAVILATGAWDLLTDDGRAIGLPVEPQRGQLIHLDLPGAATGAWPFVTGFHSHYLLSFRPHRVVAGATREDGSGFDPRITAGGVREVISEALRVAPGLADASLAELRSGLRPVSPDGLPVVGSMEGLGGVVVATGLGASGLTLGPYTGAVAARLAVGDLPPPGLDLAPFDPGRITP